MCVYVCVSCFRREKQNFEEKVCSIQCQGKILENLHLLSPLEISIEIAWKGKINLAAEKFDIFFTRLIKASSLSLSLSLPFSLFFKTFLSLRKKKVVSSVPLCPITVP